MSRNCRPLVMERRRRRRGRCRPSVKEDNVVDICQVCDGTREEETRAPIRGGRSLLIRRGARTTMGRGPIPSFLPYSC